MRPSWQEFYLSPHGRIKRRDFWLRGSVLSLLITVVALFLLPVDPLPSSIAQAHPLLDNLANQGVSLLLNLPFLCIGIKRCHDMNISSWLLLLYFVPYIGALVLYILLGFVPGTRGPNHYGPNPRQKLVPAL